MELQDVVTELKKHNKDKIIKNGFHEPHSYRGIYEDVSFEPTENIPIKEMLACAEEAMDATYGGWKGGEWNMHPDTTVHLANEGCTEDTEFTMELLIKILSNA